MRHWSQLGIRNWRAKPGRTAGALAAIALGVGVVIWVTCAYESVRLALADQVWFWIGRSHLAVESSYGQEGVVFQSIERELQSIPNIESATSRLRDKLIFQPLTATGSRPEGEEPPPQAEYIEGVGIDPAAEHHFRAYDPARMEGRPLQVGDTDAALVERLLAARYGLRVGDRFMLSRTAIGEIDAPQRTATFTIVGLVEHRRVAKQQLPIVMAMLDRVQDLAGYGADPVTGDPPRVTRIEIRLKDFSLPALRATETEVRRVIARHRGQGFIVTSSEAKIQQVQAAEKQTGFILLLISTIALFTAFFVILSTLSMGMVERIRQLGLLRCLGTTRRQIAALVLAEAVPLGITGILLGVPVGLALARLSVWLVPEYVGTFAVSRPGLVLALGGGAVITLIGALLPMLQAMRVSPLAASRPQSRPSSTLLIWAAAVLGAAMIAGHVYMLRTLSPPLWFQPQYALAGVALLYCGYAMLTPALVLVAGQGAVWIVSRLLRVRHRLLSDQVGRAAWRSAGICCGLMVGLSLIVALVVHSNSLAEGWNFPRDFCEAFVYVRPPIPIQRAEQLRRTPGVSTSALVNASIQCSIGGGLFRFASNRFVAGDPEEFFKIARLDFLEGEKDEAIARLNRGGAILVTPEFVRTRKIGKGDRIFIKANAPSARGDYFEIAGVVTSPALDIAANYFNQSGLLASAAAGVVLGTQADARRVLNVPHEASMFLINFDLPAHGVPPEFEAPQPPRWTNGAAYAHLVASWEPYYPERAAELQQIRGWLASTRPAVPWREPAMVSLFRDALRRGPAQEWDALTPQERWMGFREELVMFLIARRSGSPGEDHSSVRALKQQIDRELERATLIFTTIPAVALLVAALGVANLMMANVTSRTRQIAMLRAIGATKWQVVRLVIGEALILGGLGSLIGVALGVHAAHGMNTMTEAIWGFAPKLTWDTMPWDWVLLGIAFTVGVCLIAGIIPARHAARNNIIDAMQTT